MIGVIALTLAGNSPSKADEVVMTSGERFNTSKVWEENGKIRFNMNGLVVSVQKSDVVTIIGTNGSTRKIDHKMPVASNMTPSGQEHSAIGRPRLQPTKPLASPKPEKKSKASAKKRPRAKGIGFSGISWHMRPADLPGLKKIKTEPTYGGIDQYWRPDKSMTLGDVLLDGLVFGFWQDRLYSIMIWVDGKTAYKGLKRVILDRYGNGQESKNHPNRHVWVDDKTTDRMLEFDAVRNIGFFWMRSRDLNNHIKKLYPDT